MKLLSPIRFWIATILLISFTCTMFYIGESSKSKASSQQASSPLPAYQIVNVQLLSVPLSASSAKEKKVLKGMVITQANSQDELKQIAEDMKKKYYSKHVDYIEFTVHNRNNGMFEEEALSFEPISKGTITIAYTPLGQDTLNMQKNKAKLPSVEVFFIPH